MIKCVVWDLDDTLWQGILAEGDDLLLPDEIRTLLNRMDQVGILQSIASRNEPAAAEEQLKRFGIDHFFLYSQYHLPSKAAAIEKIAKKLHIGLESIVFLDDSEFELEEVSYFLPQVQCFHRRHHWADFCDAIEQTITSLQHNITYESKNRRAFFQIEGEKEAAKLSFTGSRDAFLKSCHMTLNIALATEEGLPRVMELIHRTNQFRTFLDKADAETCQTYMQDRQGHKVLLTARLNDRFGDYGIVGVAFLTEHVIEQFCISCRVGGRGVAAAFLHAIIQSILQRYPHSQPECRFALNDRNLPMLILLQSMGFASQHTEETITMQPHPETCIYILQKEHTQAPEWITVTYLIC
jgi:FkbH-like protein